MCDRSPCVFLKNSAVLTGIYTNWFSSTLESANCCLPLSLRSLGNWNTTHSWVMVAKYWPEWISVSFEKSLKIIQALHTAMLFLFVIFHIKYITCFFNQCWCLLKIVNGCWYILLCSVKKKNQFSTWTLKSSIKRRFVCYFPYGSTAIISPFMHFLNKISRALYWKI